jgi:beta-lactamase superfamily II metal-dependent hydrolase
VGQDIIEILSKNNMLDKNDRFYVNVLKVPHHGSDRNTTQEFFKTVIAE